MFGVLFPVDCVRVEIGAVTVSGAPEDKVKIPPHCQRSTNLWTSRGALFRKARFGPNGSSNVPLLATEFLRRFARQNGKDLRGFTDGAMNTLTNHHWPGNVRELENVVLQAVVLAKSAFIDTSDLPKRIIQSPTTVTAPATAALADQLGEPERQILVNALRRHGGNIKRTAEMLDISRTTLYAKLRKYQVDPDAIR